MAYKAKNKDLGKSSVRIAYRTRTDSEGAETEKKQQKEVEDPSSPLTIFFIIFIQDPFSCLK